MKKLVLFAIGIAVAITLLMGLLVSFWVAVFTAVSILILFLGALGYLEKIIALKLSPRLRVTLLVCYLVFSLALLTVNIVRKREYQRIKADVINMKEYGEVATWNFDGTKTIGGGVGVSSPVANWYGNYVKTEGTQISWKCTDDALTHYKSIIHYHLQYPFPYYLIAACLKQKKDVSWKGFAEDGISILEHTTKVPGHSPSHDFALKRLREMVSEISSP